MVTVSVSGSSVQEGTGSSDPYYLAWTFTVSEAATTPVTVQYRFLSGTAEAGSDAYAFNSGTSVTFQAGETSKSVYYRIDADAVVEPDETIVLEAFSPSGAALAGDAPILRSTGWILDDDGAGDKLALFVSRPVVVEGDAGTRQAVFEISLSRPAPAAFALAYHTVDGSALAGQDYQAASGSVQFAAGETKASVSIAILGDATVEPTEGFTLAVDAPPSIAAISLGEAELLDDDAGSGAGVPTISVSGSSALEGTTSSDPFYLAWTITLSEAVTSAVTVQYRFLSGTAQAGADAYDFNSGSSVTFQAGETSKTVLYRIDGDGAAEPDESIVLEVFSPSGAALAGAEPVLRSTSWILDDDGTANKLALFVSRPLVVEGDAGTREAVFEISLSRPAPEAFSIAYHTVDGSAVAGEDYQAANGTLSFVAGQTKASVSVAILGDTAIEPTEGFTLAIDAPSTVAAVSLGETQLLDDDAGNNVPTVSISGSSALEGTTSSDPFYLAWTITLSEASASAVTVQYRFLSGTAQVGADAYAFNSGTSVTFAAGETSKTVFYRIDGDGVAEPDENIVLEAFSPSGAALAGGAPVLRAGSWILDDDGSGNKLALFVSRPLVVEGDGGTRHAVFEVELSRPAPQAFSVAYHTVDGSAVAGEDFLAAIGTLSFVAGQTKASVSVEILGDAVVEPTEGFTLAVDAPSSVAAVSLGEAALLDDDAGAAAGVPTLSISGSSALEGTTSSDPFYLAWTITLSEAATSPVTVQYRFLSGSGFAAADAYAFNSGTSVTFQAGETSKTVQYRINADTLAEADETIVLEAFSPSGAALAGAAPVLRAASWILDDDGAGDKLALFVSNPVIVEGNAGTRQAVFEVSLSRPAPGGFDLAYHTIDGSATAGEDYHAASGTLSFVAGQTQASVSVEILGDGTIEPTESFSLAIDAPASVAAVSPGVATVLDDDAGATDGVPTVSVSGSSVPEGTTSSDPYYLTWTITLSEAAASAVAVQYRFVSGTGQAGSDAYAFNSGTSVTFQAGETSKTVQYRIDADTLAEQDESILLEVTGATGAALSGNAPVLQAASWILDDDGTGDKLAVSVSSPVVVEGDSGVRQAVFVVQLSQPATQAFTLAYHTVDGSAAAGQDYQAASGSVAFSAGQTTASVSIAVLPDNLIEPDETFLLELATPGGPVQGTATIVGDDLQNPPDAAPDNYRATAGQALAVAAAGGVLANDFDPEGDAFVAELVAGPAHGTLQLNADGSFTYTPAGSFSGVDHFTYAAYDGIDHSGPATVTITVAPLVASVTAALHVPSTMSPGATGAGTITYQNHSSGALDAVLFRVDAGAALLADPLTGVKSGTLFLLGLGDGSGAVEVNEAGTVGFDVQMSNAPRARATVSLSVINPDQALDWTTHAGELRPEFIADDAWARIFANFRSELGDTVGSLTGTLAENAHQLASFGIEASSAAAALWFEMQQAGDFGSIAARAAEGSAGRGWAFVGDLRLEIGAAGDVALMGSADLDALHVLAAGDAAYYTLSASVGRSVALDGTLRDTAVPQQPMFVRNIDGSFSASGFDGSLEKTATGFVLHRANGDALLFDASGDFLEMVARNGQETTATYDSAGAMVALEGPNGARLDFQRDAQGKLLSITDADATTVALDYSSNGERLVGTTAPDGTARFNYDAQGNLAQAVPAGGPSAAFAYDSDARLASIDVAGGLELEVYSYDSLGNFTVTDGAGHATHVELLPGVGAARVADGSGAVTSLIYAEDGALTGVEGPDGSITGLAFDEQGRLLSATDPNGGTIHYSYDGASSMPSSFTDAAGNTRAFLYDDAGQLVGLVWPDGTQLAFTFDAEGNVASLTGRRGDDVAFEYDGHGQLTTASDSSAGPATYSYDSHGHLLTATTGEGVTALGYDAAGNVTTVAYPDGRSLSFTYDDAGRRTGMADQDGNSQTYAYDAAGRLVAIGNNDGVLTSYSYDAAGNLAGESNRNGTTTTYVYDAAGRVVDILHLDALGKENSHYAYVYDVAGHRVEQDTPEGAWTYAYDGAGQLVGAHFASDQAGLSDRTIAYEYDAAGNRTRVVEDGVETIYVTNALNQYVSIGATTFTYDAGGNMVSRTDASGTWTYAYDLNNHLVSATGSAGQLTQYEYDVFGNRSAEIVDGVRTEFLVDPLGLGNVVGAYADDGTLTASYAHGLGLAARIGADGSTQFYDADGVGSIVALTDAAGAVLNTYAYMPFGQLLSASEAVANTFQFNGELGVEAEVAGLSFMRARFYDAIQGRFLSEDPRWLDGDTANLYRFAWNDPVLFVDPSGESPLTDFIGTGAGVLGGAFAGYTAGQVVQNLGGLQHASPQDVIALGVQAFVPLLTSAALVAIGLSTTPAWLVAGAFAAGFYFGLHSDAKAESLITAELSTSGASNGDPHLRTFDGLYYDFQGVGEFTLVQGDDLEIQVRQQPWGNRTTVAINTAVAMQVGDDVVGLYGNEASPLNINGSFVSIASGETISVGDGSVYRVGNSYTVLNAHGDGFRANANGSYINIQAFLGDGHEGTVSGLLGNSDGIAGNDLALADGAALGAHVAAQVLYGAYAKSWRVTPETSLFIYGPGESTESFIDRSFPAGVIRYADLTPEQRAPAEAAATAAGLTPGTVEFESAVLDIVLTGDTSFAETAAAVLPPPSGQPTQELVVNLPPVAGADQAATNEDVVVTIDVLANDSDPENDPLSLVSATATGGSVAVLGAMLVFTPDANFNGTASFAYVVADGVGNQSDGAGTVEVAAVNDDPAGLALSNSMVAENSAIGTVVGTLSAVDADGDALAFSIDGSAGPFAVVGNVLKVAAPIDFEATQSFLLTLVATDASGARTTLTTTITVTDVVEGGGTPVPIPPAFTFSNGSQGNGQVPAGATTTQGLATTFDNGVFLVEATGPWNGVKNLLTTIDAWSSVLGDHVTVANFVDARLDLSNAGDQDLTLAVVGLKRGVIATGDGDDTIDLVFQSNEKAWVNTAKLATGGGNDVVHATAAGFSTLDDALLADNADPSNGPLWNAAYDGRFSTLEVDLGEGDDRVVAAGVALVAKGGAGNDTLVGGNGARGDVLDGGAGTDTYTGGGGWDQFILRAGEADDDVITDFEGVGAAQGDVVRLLGFAAGATVVEAAPGAYAIQQGGTVIGTFFAAAGLAFGKDVFFV